MTSNLGPVYVWVGNVLWEAIQVHFFMNERNGSGLPLFCKVTFCG